ncbi:hypothetical protein [Streptomyces sp. WMMC905]|uniref:hypothetical protein n=1 Tax=Streptomyces sp. WMMC905 TaxID=3404123 RepID=UPI003B92F3A0
MKPLAQTVRKRPVLLAGVITTVAALAAGLVLLLPGDGPVRPDAGKCREEAVAEVEAAVADGSEIARDMPAHCQGLPREERDEIVAESADDVVRDEMREAREAMERMAATTGP